jgi:hypothetical protein
MRGSPRLRVVDRRRRERRVKAWKRSLSRLLNLRRR